MREMVMGREGLSVDRLQQQASRWNWKHEPPCCEV